MFCNNKKAFQLFTENLKQSEQVEDYLSKAEALHGIGSYHGRNGKNSEKYELYKQAYDLQIEFNDINGQMKSQIAIGKILFSQGKYKDAIEMYQLALLIFYLLPSDQRDRRYLLLLSSNQIKDANDLYYFDVTFQPGEKNFLESQAMITRS